MSRIVLTGLLTAMVVGVGLSVIGFATAPQFFEVPPNLYRSADFRFELPRGWKCVLDGTEWVCQYKKKGERQRAAIMVLARKRRSTSMDSLDAYEEHLRTPRKYKSPNGNSHESKIIYVRRVQQGRQRWVDSKHLGSEIPNYYTRYLAMVTSHSGILLTYSVHKKHTADIEPQLEHAFASLKITQRN